MSTELTDLKVKLKTWEKQFSEENGRKPSGADIRDAGSEIMKLYSRYSELRKTTKPPDDAWGKHLNRSNTPSTPSNENTGSSTPSDIKKSKPSVFSKIHSKILASQGAGNLAVLKSSKGVFERTSVGRQSRGSDSENDPKVLKSETSRSADCENDSKSKLEKLNVDMAKSDSCEDKTTEINNNSKIEDISNKSEQSLDNETRIFKKAVRTVKPRPVIPTDMGNKTEESLDVPEPEFQKAMRMTKPSIFRSQSTSGSIFSNYNGTPRPTVPKLRYSSLRMTDDTDIDSSKTVESKPKSTDAGLDCVDEPSMDISPNRNSEDPVARRKSGEETSKSEFSFKTSLLRSGNQEPISLLRSGNVEPRNDVNKHSVEKSDSNSETRTKKASCGSPSSEAPSKTNFSPKRTARKRTESDEQLFPSEDTEMLFECEMPPFECEMPDSPPSPTCDDDLDTLESETPQHNREPETPSVAGLKLLEQIKSTRISGFSIRDGNLTENRVISPPKVKSRKRARKESETETENLPDDDSPVKKPAAKKKRTGGATAGRNIISDNFVRVNLKKKKFVRGAKTMTGSKYKRQQWKQRMKSRGGAGSGDKCFKCGESGHWANKCTGKPGGPKSTGLDPELQAMKNDYEKAEEEMEETPFPTLEEAAAMATGHKKIAEKKTMTSVYEKKKPKAKPKPEAHEPEIMAEDFPDDADDGDWMTSQNDIDDVIPSKANDNAPTRTVQPCYEICDDGSVPPTPQAVKNALKIFGYQEFRAGQENAIMRILCGQSTLVVLSTGAGKSLCYKLPAYLYAKQRQALTLVISPLVSLMEDQIADLPPGIVGACLHTNMTKPQREKVAAQVYEGKVQFLLMSPESLVGGGESAGIVNFSKLPPIAVACIDEAHCLSEWSHHFRPSYLRVCKVLRDKLGVQCMLGLTATATVTTAVSVAHHLAITDFGRALITGVPVPSNLRLSVSKDENRLDALINLLQGDRFNELNSIIIYCTRRQQTEQIAVRIRTCLGDKSKPKPKGRAKKYTKKPNDQSLDWDAEPYHAGLSASARKRVQNLFMSGNLRVVVATVAFGMGLDKSDVRAVIHFNLPKTFESYVQEIGRAGRDGLPAHCHLFLGENDLSELRRHTYGNTVDRITIKRLVRLVFPACKCRAIAEHTGGGKTDSDDKTESTKNSKSKTDNETSDSEMQDPDSKVDDCVSKTEVKDVYSKTDEPRICHGHERAIPIENVTNSLDVKEEGIGTLLCYLELHPKEWVENLRPTYATCTIRCYGGPSQLKETARKCPPVAAAIALARRSAREQAESNDITFPVVEVADKMGWDGGPVKRELYGLQWCNGRKSGTLVEFSDLAFHLRSHGDLTDEEIDEVVDFLNERVQMQERTEIAQLKRLYETLEKACSGDWYDCEVLDTDKSNWLRQKLLEYFEEAPVGDPSKITMLSFTREMYAQPEESNDNMSSRDNHQLLSDIHSFIGTYSHEHTLSGRAIARIFQGIPSPRFPVNVWGRVRKYWRSHLNADFNHIRTLATRELVKYK